MIELLRKHWEELSRLYQQFNTITEIAQEFCRLHKKEYTDSWRRAVSKVVNEKAQNNTSAKILLIDIETAPALSYVWGAWNQNPGTNLAMVQDDWFMLTWSAKWLFDKKVLSDKLTSEEAIQQDDSRIANSIWKLLDEADIVIAHNAIKFDIKRLNTRFLKAGYNPPMPYQIIDTYVHAKKSFALFSNKLDFIAKDFLGLEGKIKHSGFELWESCMKGDTEALLEMEEYNIQDVRILEDVYLELRPWIKPHPNIGLFVGKEVKCCATCGSEDLEWGSNYVTYANTYQACRCNSCGAVGRSRKSNTLNKSITLSTPK